MVSHWKDTPGPSELLFQSDGMVVEKAVSPFCQENSYIVIDPTHRAAIIIDPGLNVSPVAKAVLSKWSCTLDYAFLTHEHYDHIAGLTEIRGTHNCTVVASHECSRNIGSSRRNLSIFYDPPGYVADPAEVAFQEYELFLSWHDHEFRLFCTPGHSSGSICISVSGHLFTGDTIIKGTRIPVKLAGGSGRLLQQSLECIFASFPPETVLHPGHGPSLVLGDTWPGIHYPPAQPTAEPHSF